MLKLKPQLTTILEGKNVTIEDKLQEIAQFLDQNIDYYNWTGFYFKNGDKDELKLGPYVGAPTDHIIIPYGKGICGQVAMSNQTFEVPDVKAESNYLSCSISTKAELVVPIFKNGENIGQIDIDSHQINPFTNEDRELLEWLCDQIGQLM